MVSVTSNRIVLGNADTTAQSRTNETIYSTPEYIPSNDEYLNATQIEYDVEDAPAFEEIAPYLISEGETYIDATTIRNNTMAEITSLIGNVDRRTHVTTTTASPYNRIGLIVAWYDKNENGKWDNGELSYGTGSMQGPDVVLTAGHVIMKNGVWAHRVYYYPAKNGTGSDSTGEPYGQATSIACYTSSNWKNSSDSNYDYGIVIVNRNIGALTGYNGKAWTSGSLAGKTVTITGYPGEKTGELKETMWSMSGTIAYQTDYKAFYQIDTTAGQSGAPVYDSSNTVWAIHAYGTLTQGSYNSGVRITQSIYNLLQEKLDEGLEKYYS